MVGHGAESHLAISSGAGLRAGWEPYLRLLGSKSSSGSLAPIDWYPEFADRKWNPVTELDLLAVPLGLVSTQLVDVLGVGRQDVMSETLGWMGWEVGVVNQSQ